MTRIKKAMNITFMHYLLPLVDGGKSNAQAVSAGSLLEEKKNAQVLPTVAILLGTHFGEQYLAQQLDSIAAQTYPQWRVWASDDGSHDATPAILGAYQEKWGSERLAMCKGPEQGFAANYLSLTCSASIDADYYAYCDQDDIWEQDKLQRAIDWLMTIPVDVPSLYCGRTRLVDAENREIGLSSLSAKRPSFANALMQSIGGANTMVFNEAARKLLREAGADLEVVSHDCWAYLVVIGCGGEVFYDSCPTLRYRQHEGNLVGTNISWNARWVRIRLLWQGLFRARNGCQIQSLQRLGKKLTPVNRDLLNRFSESRNRWLVPRLYGLFRCGLYRQSMIGNLGLIFAALFKKI